MKRDMDARANAAYFGYDALYRQTAASGDKIPFRPGAALAWLLPLAVAALAVGRRKAPE